MIPQSHNSATASVVSGLVQLLESGLPDPSALESALRAIPLKHWNQSIEVRDVVATWSVRATVPHHAAEPLQIYLERQKSFIPNDATIEVSERFDGRIIYSTRDQAVAVTVPLSDRPRLVQELLETLSGKLGETDSLTAR